MDEHALDNFKRKFKCTLALLGQPVMDYDSPFVTVAFTFAPVASDYKRFFDAGWEPYGVVGHGRYPLNAYEDTYIEVTFKHRESSATLPVPY